MRIPQSLRNLASRLFSRRQVQENNQNINQLEQPSLVSQVAEEKEEVTSVHAEERSSKALDDFQLDDDLLPSLTFKVNRPKVVVTHVDDTNEEGLTTRLSESLSEHGENLDNLDIVFLQGRFFQPKVTQQNNQSLQQSETEEVQSVCSLK